MKTQKCPVPSDQHTKTIYDIEKNIHTQNSHKNWYIVMHNITYKTNKTYSLTHAKFTQKLIYPLRLARVGEIFKIHAHFLSPEQKFELKLINSLLSN